MDLTPLYELRERLKAGAIAGTSLLTEDFRLPRALEALSPLEAASPVFAKIGQSVRALLDPACSDRAAALLDALSLADAVLTTQGAVAASCEPEPLTLTARGSAITNAPYSVLSPLMDALTNSGSGRYSFVVETHEQRPALFTDYRVKHALVQALGASYSDLANQAEEWLCKEDESILPLLMEGFDPQGKREMVRRVHVIEEVAGNRANDFYLSLLETAEKEVRGAAIYALRLSDDNADRLVSLAKTEKGAAKKQAHWALARMEVPAVWDYWQTLAAKKPEQAADYMALSDTVHAGELIAQALCTLIAPFENGGSGEVNKEFVDRLQRLLYALPGKYGPAICGFYRRAAALGTALDLTLEGEKKPFLLDAGMSCRNGGNLPFSEVLPFVLYRALLLNPKRDLLALAAELSKTGPGWAVPELAAALLSKGEDEAWAIGKDLIPTAFGLFRNKQNRSALSAVLGSVYWDAENHRQSMLESFFDPAAERTFYQSQPLAEPLNLHWYQALAKGKDSQDDLLIRLIQPENPPVRQFLAEYFYRRATAVQSNQKYMTPLRQLGWTKCEGLGVRFCEGQKKLSYWQVESLFRQMPGTNTDKALEAGRVIKLAEDGKLTFQNSNYGIADLRKLAEDLRSNG